MKVIFHGFVRNELVDQHSLAAGDAVSDQGHEVTVVNPADDLHLSLELPLTLPAPRLETLHGNFLAVR